MERHESLTSQGTLQWDINNLVRELRQERLFVSSEQQELQSLNEQVVNDSQNLAQAAWVAAQQRFNLNKLILSQPDSTPSACCQRANSLDSTRFIDAYKVLPYQDCLVYGDFLQTLRVSPELLAQCLVLGEHIAGSQLVTVVPSIISGLYGNLIMPHDTVLVLRLLRKLIQLQLVESDNPQRILQHGSCSFTRLYSTFHEALFSAKLFLTAALKAPILKLLVDIEYFLDIDPDKALVRFQPADRLKKFGKEGTPEYAARVAHYRKWTIDSLYAISSRFILSLQENMHCFPAPLAWIIQQISSLLTKSGNFSIKEVNATVTDLIFTYFICPAMVNPEPYGITDAPISYISRFNLIQVAQIIQMLALIKYQEVDVKVKDLYSKFDKHCVSTLIDMILDGCLETLDDVPITLDSVELRGLSRSSAFFTESELHNLVTFLQTISQSFEQSSNDDSMEEAAAIITPMSKINCKGNIFTSHDQEKLHLLLCSLPSRTLNGINKSPSVDNVLKHKREENSPEIFSKKPGLLGKVSKQRITKTISLSANMLTMTSASENNQSNSCSTNEEPQMKHGHTSLSNSPSRPNSSGSDDSITSNNPEVLIIPLNLPQTEMIGLLPEQKVLSMEPSNGFSPSTNLDSVTLTNNVDDLISEQDSEERDRITVDSNELGLSAGQEKRTRFSHSHDDGSIGNTSDNLEAISEAASNHSVASSLELENEDQNDNDNLSDMISANVSGRGTPNISGRDTPSSQVTEGEDQARQETRQPFLPPPQSLINKQIRSEIDDKFCKFEIKKLLEGDETVSIISDTWSTDVLASDSETVEASDRPQFMPPVSEKSERERANVIELDGIETASESAWSTDVLASDSERMTEVDTDDTASVAPSDDTASVARSDDTARSEIEETLPSHVHRPIPISIPSTSRSTNVYGMNNSCSSDHVISHNIHSNNGLLSTSSSQPGSPLDVASSLNPFNTYTNHSNYNSIGAPANINYNLNNAFRPIREDRDLLAQISFSGRDSLVTQANVTGKGGRKSDYRRRTMEYVDNNMNNMLHSTIIPESNSSTTTSSTSTRTEISEQTSLSRNSNGTMTNTVRREAVMIDSNSISINGLEVFLEEKEHKSVTNSTNKSIEISAFKPTSLVNHSNGITHINKNTNEAINDINVTAASPILLLSNRVNGLKISSDLPVTNANLSDSSISSLNSNLTITNANLCSNSEANKNSTALDSVSQQWNIGDSSHSKWLLNGTIPSTLISTNEVSANNFNSSSKGSQTIKTSNSVPPSVIKPSTSTGAIPKSISFDMTAEKGDKDMLDDDQKNKRGFFGKLKMGFKSRRGKSLRGEDLNIRYELITDSDTPRFKRYTSGAEENNLRTNNTETSEDILAKYRRKPSVDTNTSESTASSSGSGSKSKSAENTNSIGVTTKCEDDRWTIDHNNVEASFAFLDLKRKLRLVFSTAAEVYNSPFNFHGGNSLKTTNNTVGNELISFLRIQQAKAQNLRNWPLVALINETLRCVSLFDSTVCRKLLFALKQEHAKRIAYVNYLVHCRQELLASLAHLENVKTQIASDRELSTSYLVTVCVRMFLERRDSLVLQFCDEFRNLTLADEKTDLLETFLQTLSSEMDRDANWRDASESQLELARIAIERTLISRVYSYAMFPNGDGDISRDQVLQDHIRKLSKVITPSHKDLRIPKIFHYECPWPSAQDAISAISAYKTARDKVKCVMRCALSIMHLLSLAIERGAPTADDFTPVLVYVLIKANPPSLLSTIQYVNSFYSNRLAGEEQYWWIQFCSAVEFIKTMDYSE